MPDASPVFEPWRQEEQQSSILVFVPPHWIKANVLFQWVLWKIFFAGKNERRDGKKICLMLFEKSFPLSCFSLFPRFCCWQNESCSKYAINYAFQQLHNAWCNNYLFCFWPMICEFLRGSYRVINFCITNKHPSIHCVSPLLGKKNIKNNF